MACRRMGWRYTWPLDTGTGRGRRAHQSRRPQCQLPVHTPGIGRRFWTHACSRRGCSVRRLLRPARPPRVWLQASTATIYAHRYDAPNDETSGIIGGDEVDAPSTWRFSIEVARAWEQAFNEVAAPATRKVTLRSAMTMSPDRGVCSTRCWPLCGAGWAGASGDGRQFMSWVHEEDFVRAVRWLIAHDEIDGVVNISSPNPMSNAEFMRALRDAWGIRVGLPAPDGCSRSARCCCVPRRS